jgi:hypothetical protein
LPYVFAIYGDFCGNVVFFAVSVFGLFFLILRVFDFFVCLDFWFFLIHFVGGVILVLAFPCFLIGLLALPLCGAALTFFAAAKKVSKESGLHTASL